MSSPAQLQSTKTCSANWLQRPQSVEYGQTYTPAAICVEFARSVVSACAGLLWSMRVLYRGFCYNSLKVLFRAVLEYVGLIDIVSQFTQALTYNLFVSTFEFQLLNISTLTWFSLDIFVLHRFRWFKLLTYSKSSYKNGIYYPSSPINSE